MRIKVDYSSKCKETGQHDCPGEFAIWTKDGLFKPWVECSTFAGYELACKNAERMRLKYKLIPKYF